MESLTIPPDDVHRASLRRLLADADADAGAPPPPVDVATFASWLRRQRLAPWAADRARRLGPSWSPLAAELRDDLLRAAGVEARRSAWIALFLRDLVAAGIRPVLFKGLGVAHTLYAAPHLRPLGDVDLLVRPRDLERAVAVARAHGFAEHAADPAIAAYQREEGYAVLLMHPAHGPLELHHRLYRDCEDAFVDGLLSRTVPARILGVDVELLAPADLWLVLATHWVTDSGERCWLWLLDLALLGGTLESSVWSRVSSTARAHGLELFALSAVRALELLWGVSRDVDWVAELSRSLSARERAALASVDRLGCGGALDGRRLVSVRRLAGRQVRGGRGRTWRTFVCHVGVVCEELNVRSDSRWLALHRVRHVGLRVLRAIRAIHG